MGRTRSGAKGSAKNALERLATPVVAIYPLYNAHSLSWSPRAKLTPHLLARREAGPVNISELAGWPKLLEAAGWHLFNDHSQAASLLRDALAIRGRLMKITRDAIFDAMQRKETYATTGSEPALIIFPSSSVDRREQDRAGPML